MAYASWTFRILVALAAVGVLHYNLPQRDIVRIVNTYEERRDFDDWTSVFWSGRATTSTTNPTKDVLFIQTVKANGKAMVYRNQDTEVQLSKSRRSSYVLTIRTMSRCGKL